MSWEFPPDTSRVKNGKERVVTFHTGLFDEVCQDMGLQMVDFNHGQAVGYGKSFGK